MASLKPAATPIGVNIFLIALTSLALTLRCISRKLSDAGFWWDDWLALAAWVSTRYHPHQSADRVRTWYGFVDKSVAICYYTFSLSLCRYDDSIDSYFDQLRLSQRPGMALGITVEILRSSCTSFTSAKFGI